MAGGGGGEGGLAKYLFRWMMNGRKTGIKSRQRWGWKDGRTDILVFINPGWPHHTSELLTKRKRSETFIWNSVHQWK